MSDDEYAEGPAVDGDADSGGSASEGAAGGGDATADSRDEGDLPGTVPEEALLGRSIFEEDMGPSSSLAHLYRAEVHRMQHWRERLDRTTNWAVILMAAILTWAFSSETNPHYIILVGIAAVTVFLVIEARRYRGFDMWRSRVRLLQENVFAQALDDSSPPPDPDWREKLSRDYVAPKLKLSTEQAIAHRLRRVYLPLFAVLLGAWIVRITAFSAAAWPESAAVGQLPGAAVTVAVALYVLGLLWVAFRPRRWKGELLDPDLNSWDGHGRD